MKANLTELQKKSFYKEFEEKTNRPPFKKGDSKMSEIEDKLNELKQKRETFDFP